MSEELLDSIHGLLRCASGLSEQAVNGIMSSILLVRNIALKKQAEDIFRDLDDFELSFSLLGMKHKFSKKNIKDYEDYKEIKNNWGIKSE